MMNDTIKGFFPTCKELADRMTSGIDWNKVATVLEPSAGKGDLVDAVREAAKRKFYHGIDIDCIEANPDLRLVLKGKGYRVVYNDFLTYSTEKEYSLIIMNPPFSEGSKHLLKAIEMQSKSGGAIICLLNAETIKNPYTNERKTLVRLLEEYGSDISYISHAFSMAERQTDVEVALIKVQLPYEYKKLEMKMEKTLEDERKQDESVENQNENVMSSPSRQKCLVQVDKNVQSEWTKMSSSSGQKCPVRVDKNV